MHEAAIATARAEAYRQGAVAAEAKSTADIASRSTLAAERIAAGLAQLAQGLGAVEARLEAEAVEVAVAVANKLAPR